MANTKRPSILPPDTAPVVEDNNMLSRQWRHWTSQISHSLVQMYKYDVAVDVTSVSANTTSEQTVTVTGVASNDIVVVVKPTHTAGLGIVNCRVSAKDTVAITFMNTTGSAIDPASETYTFLVIKA